MPTAIVPFLSVNHHMSNEEASEMGGTYFACSLLPETGIGFPACRDLLLAYSRKGVGWPSSDPWEPFSDASIRRSVPDQCNDPRTSQDTSLKPHASYRFLQNAPTVDTQFNVPRPLFHRSFAHQIEEKHVKFWLKTELGSSTWRSSTNMALMMKTTGCIPLTRPLLTCRTRRSALRPLRRWERAERYRRANFSVMELAPTHSHGQPFAQYALH